MGQPKFPSRSFRCGRASADRPVAAPFSYVLPGEIVARLREHVVCGGLYVTELGWNGAAAGRLPDAEQVRAQPMFVFCCGGTLRLDVGGRQIELGGGQGVLIPARSVFACAAIGPRPAAVFWFCFTGEESDYFVRNLGELLSCVTLNEGGAETGLGIFWQICGLLEKESTELSLIHLSHLARLLLSHLLSQSRCGHKQAGKPLHPGVETAVSYMQNNISLPLGLGDIARHAGLSASHFCALFRTQMGITPMEYFIRLKLQKARRLLVSSALTVQEVAQQVGYDDGYYFSRLFRKLHGLPPVAYRRAQRLAV